MDRLQETVEAIYKANAEAGDVAAFGIERSEDLPEHWQEFFQKKKTEGIRKQDQDQPEPKPKPKENEDEQLVTVLEAIIERIQALESRIEIIETGQALEELEQEPELVRKGVSPDVLLDQLTYQGLHGELRTRRGQKCQRS